MLWAYDSSLLSCCKAHTKDSGPYQGLLSTCMTTMHILLLTHISLLPWFESGWKCRANWLWCHFMLMLHCQVFKLCTFIGNEPNMSQHFAREMDWEHSVFPWCWVGHGVRWWCWWLLFGGLLFLSTVFLINTSCNGVRFALLWISFLFVFVLTQKLLWTVTWEKQQGRLCKLRD